MNLTHDAMLVGLRIAAWSGRLYDRQASTHVAVHHEASTAAGRYNKCLLPRTAFAALNSIVSAARTAHYAQSLPWDDQGSRLLPVANYERYTELMDALRERMIRERARFIEDYEDNIDRARLELGKLFRIAAFDSGRTVGDAEDADANAAATPEPAADAGTAPPDAPPAANGNVHAPAPEAGPSDGDPADENRGDTGEADSDPSVAGGPDAIAAAGPVNGHDPNPDPMEIPEFLRRVQ